MIEKLLQSTLLEDRILIRFEKEGKDKYKTTGSNILIENKVEDTNYTFREVEVVMFGDGHKSNGEKVIMSVEREQKVLTGLSSGISSEFSDEEYMYRLVYMSDILAVL